MQVNAEVETGSIFSWLFLLLGLAARLPSIRIRSTFLPDDQL